MNSQSVFADFDGDQKLDSATVSVDRSNTQSTIYSIHFRLSDGLQSQIGITASTGGLQLFSRDVNGDDKLDLVVRASWDSSLVAVLVNDGHGKFTKLAPERFPELQKVPENYLIAQKRPFVEAASVLPGRSAFGEEAESVPSERLSKSSEEFTALEREWFCCRLIESNFGRSPPTQLTPRNNSSSF